MGAHIVDHLCVDALGRAAQRQLAQRGEIAGHEIAADGALRLLRNINLAFLQTLDEVFGCQVD